MNAPLEIKHGLAAAFVRAQREFAPALKTSSNPAFKSKYADLASCVAAVIDALNNNGLALWQKPTQTQTEVTVETILIHESGEQLSFGSFSIPVTKHDAHGTMSALTYCRRGSLMAAMGIAPEDDDGNLAAAAKPSDADRAKQKATYEAADAALLAQYREAALEGTAALQAFHSMAKGEGKARVWEAHNAALKAAAKQADTVPA